MLDLSKYQNPALHFSGGKDSLACLYLLREQLDQVTVYWLNTGDGCPETLEVIEKVRPNIPHFVEVRTDAKAWRAHWGDPSDLVPASSHGLGIAYGMSELKLVNRFDCCYANLMLPMHNRMVEDRVDAVIRGTKLADTGKVPHHGPTPFYDIVLPLLDWSHEQVFEYLRSVQAPVNPLYNHFKSISAPECLTCTAWWDDGKAEYLKTRHPAVHQEYSVKLSAIKQALQQHLRQLDDELEVQ